MPKTKERAPVRSAGPGRGPRRRWTNLRPLLVLVLLVVLAGAGWGIVYHSPLLDARKVAIGGLTVLQRDQIAAVAAVPVGEPLAGIDLDAIRARVAAVPRVASVRVEREWPHTVRISVRERTTALVVPDAGRYAEIDKDGVRFGTVDAAPSGVPVVKADANTVSRETLRGVVQVVSALPPPVAQRVRDITARTRDDIVLTLDKGESVSWGGADASDRKALILTVLLQRPAKFYDVGAPDAPVTRTQPLPAQAEPAAAQSLPPAPPVTAVPTPSTP
ncbi:cell division protein FtsQ/DivIB [Embleya sp. NBC_00896]|uniref:cell division protein FtsQ/DivIB n=1 Tax=Embleya sp. NBC_00896 TaxID=2975961 RepID=UPI00386D5A87|nr:FtsQ-type POTRA domain-containing protein [Embleya sp. NBC_00896]